jgi:hypothetical protein
VALRRALTRSELPRFASRYDRHDYTDMPSIITTVALDGRYKQIEHYFGDTSAPPELIMLEEELDRIVEIERFIGSAEERETMHASW